MSTDDLTVAPWARNPDPTPIPADTHPAALRNLADDEFVALIRDNLMPRSGEAGDRRPWQRLWCTIGGNTALGERTLDVLAKFIDQAEDAIDAGAEGRQLKRVQKFREQCDRAWDRIEAKDSPLGWAGPAGRGLSPRATMLVATLVEAIATHRASVEIPTSVDRALWAVLEQIGLDPVAAAAEPPPAGDR